MRVLVTGGAGYIGSHTVLKLLERGDDVLVYDNFSNSSPEALKRVEELTGKSIEAREGDLRDKDLLHACFEEFRPDAVIHFAGLKAVGESQAKPLEYYSQNVAGSVNLFQCMQLFDCRRLVFSSSATVYGDAKTIPIDESQPLAPVNAYGRTKYFVEEIVRDWCSADPETSAVLLRYFNPVGAHESGRIGEDPNDIPNNLMPFISQVAVGRREKLSVFGNDYETRDGTGERDYIHVVDLAEAHLAALDYTSKNSGAASINVGTGNGATVLEMVHAFAEASGREIPYEIVARRSGDVAQCVASVDVAKDLLNWTAKLDVSDMCSSTWRWQSSNPSGYRS